MNELESDVWLSKKGENKGTFAALRMLQTIVNNEMHGSFPNMYICLGTSRQKLFRREVSFCSETC